MEKLKQTIRWHDVRGFARRTKLRLSLRFKITIGLLVVMLLILPAVFVSLFYLSRILDTVDEITEQDVEILRIADQINLKINQARRAESNYQWLRAPEPLEKNRELIREVISLADSGSRLVGQDAMFIRIRDAATMYNSHMVNLEEIVENSPVLKSDYSRRQEYYRIVTDFKKKYFELLEEADKAEGAERDSLQAEIVRYITEFSPEADMDDIFPTTETDRTGEEYTRDALNRESLVISTTAVEIGLLAHKNIKLHRQESRLINEQAKRNTVIIVIITLFISISMVLRWPSKMVRPLTLLTNALERAASGEPTPILETRFEEELRSLIIWYNRFTTRTRKFSQLRIEKIALQQKRILLLLDRAPEAWIILNPDLTITGVNDKTQKWLNIKEPLSDKNLSGVEELNSLHGVVRRERDRLVHSAIQHVEIRFRMPNDLRLRKAYKYIRNICFCQILADHPE